MTNLLTGNQKQVQVSIFNRYCLDKNLASTIHSENLINTIFCGRGQQQRH